MTRRQILHTIAAYELALGAEKEIHGMEGYAEHYLKSLDRPSLKLLSAYNKIRAAIAKEAADRMEAVEADKHALAELPTDRGERNTDTFGSIP